jgi:hypothetical protein
MTEGLDLSPIAAKQSEDWVLELKPRTYAEATEGPHAVPDQTEYVTLTKPDGDTFLAPVANVPVYEAKGYTAGASVTIDDKWTYVNDPANQAPAEPPPAPEGGASGQ